MSEILNFPFNRHSARLEKENTALLSILSGQCAKVPESATVNAFQFQCSFNFSLSVETTNKGANYCSV